MKKTTHEKSSSQGRSVRKEQCVRRATHEVATHKARMCEAATCEKSCNNTRRPTTT